MLGPFPSDSLKQPSLTAHMRPATLTVRTPKKFLFELCPFVLASVLCDLPKLIALITEHVLCHLSSHECAAAEKRLSH